MFLMILLWSGSDVFTQILFLCLCAYEHTYALVCRCTCVRESRGKLHGLFLRCMWSTVVCLGVLLLLLVVVASVCFVLFEAGSLTGLEFVG